MGLAKSEFKLSNKQRQIRIELIQGASFLHGIGTLGTTNLKRILIKSILFDNVIDIRYIKTISPYTMYKLQLISSGVFRFNILAKEFEKLLISGLN